MSAGREVRLGRLWGLEAAALVVDGRIEDLLVDPAPLAPHAPGAILRGVVDRVMPGQGGAFLRLPDGATGYLRDRAGARAGQARVVQVSGVAEAGKAVPVTTRLLLRGRTAIATPDAPGVNVSRRLRDPELRAALEAAGAAALAGQPEGLGLILRSAAGVADPAEVEAEARELATLAAAIAADTQGGPEVLLDAPSPHESAWRDWADPAPDTVREGDDALDDLDAQIEALLGPRVALPGGASAYIETTRALVAVDVNTGADGSPAAGLKANIALVRDLPRQLRLRGLGGQVVLDLAPMPKRDRGPFEQSLRAAVKAEGAETSLIGWTAMGLYELTRKRDRVPLAALAAAAR